MKYSLVLFIGILIHIQLIAQQSPCACFDHDMNGDIPSASPDMVINFDGETTVAICGQVNKVLSDNKKWFDEYFIFECKTRQIISTGSGEHPVLIECTDHAITITQLPNRGSGETKSNQISVITFEDGHFKTRVIDSTTSD